MGGGERENECVILEEKQIIQEGDSGPHNGLWAKPKEYARVVKKPTLIDVYKSCMQSLSSSLPTPPTSLL